MAEPKVVSVDVKPSEFVLAVDEMRRNMTAYLEYQRLLAEVRKAGYDAYLEQGFSEEQALELCKATSG